MEEKTNTLIAYRIPPSDRWRLADEGSEGEIHNSLTEVLEAYFQKTQQRCDFKLSPLKGELYALIEQEDEPVLPKKFNLYGDY